MAGPPLLALVGPTASGKSEAAVLLAERLGAEIVSVDSMLVYRGMDVGTAKPGPAERARVRHHLIDVVAPGEQFSVARYQALAPEALAEVAARGNRVLLVGGSGLYFRAIADELEFPTTDPRTRAELEVEAVALGARRLHTRLTALDPVAAAKIEPANVRRTVRALEVAAVTGRRFSDFAAAWQTFAEERVRPAGVAIDRAVLFRRIQARVEGMLSAGFPDEVRGLLDRGLSTWIIGSQAIGYAEMARHLEGELSQEEALAGTVRRTKALARRQLAWFRRDPRIRWFEAGEDGASAIVDEILEHLIDG